MKDRSGSPVLRVDLAQDRIIRSGGQFAFGQQAGNLLGGHVIYVALALVEQIDFLGDRVDAGHVKSGFAQDGCQWQANVAHAEHGNAGFALAEFLFEGF